MGAVPRSIGLTFNFARPQILGPAGPNTFPHFQGPPQHNLIWGPCKAMSQTTQAPPWATCWATHLPRAVLRALARGPSRPHRARRVARARASQASPKVDSFPGAALARAQAQARAQALVHHPGHLQQGLLHTEPCSICLGLYALGLGLGLGRQALS